jgi:hypothetical protein
MGSPIGSIADRVPDEHVRCGLAEDASPGLKGGPPRRSGLKIQRPRTEQEWLTVLRQFRDTLEQICRTPLVRGDYAAQRIIYDILAAPNPEFVDTQLDRLAERVAELLAKKNGSAAAAAPVAVTSQAQARTALKTAYNAHADLAEETERPVRTFLRL